MPDRLTLPPNAHETDAVEVLTVWARPGLPQQLTLQPTWPDPAAWGLMIRDITRHAARAYAANGTISESEALARIMTAFDAESMTPTDSPDDLG